MQLKKRAFVQQLDFLTSPGHLQGGDTRQAQGIPGQGPELVITGKAIFNFENAEREMQLVSLYPGITLEQVQSEVGWQVKLAEPLSQASPPTREELQLIRVQLDPNGMYSRSAPRSDPQGARQSLAVTSRSSGSEW